MHISDGKRRIGKQKKAMTKMEKEMVSVCESNRKTALRTRFRYRIEYYDDTQFIEGH